MSFFLISKLAGIAAVCALLTAGAATAQPADAPLPLSPSDEAAALAWLKRSARTLSSESPTAAELKPLLARLGNARVVGLGGTTPGAHEEFAFNAALIKALAGAGRINAVAFIASFQSAKRLDAYIAGGPGTGADALRESGLPPMWLTQEMVDLLDWLRAWNLARSDRLRIVGVDVQDALRDTQVALAVLAELEPEAAGPLEDTWRAQLTHENLQRRFPAVAGTWTRAQWEALFVAAQVLEDLLSRPTARLLQSPRYSEARHSARAARLGLLAYEVSADTGSASDAAADAALAHDLAVGEQLLAVVGPPARAVLWAHDAQVVRRADGNPATTGELLLDRLGTGYRALGFAWRQGAFNAMTVGPSGDIDEAAGLRSRKVALSGDALGALIARTDRRQAWFETANLPDAPWAKRWRAQPYERGWFGLGGEKAPPTPLGEGFDVLVFFRTITPTRLLPP